MSRFLRSSSFPHLPSITSLAMLSISELGGVLFEERYPLNQPFIIIEGKSTYP